MREKNRRMKERERGVMSGTLLLTACLQLSPPNLPLRPQNPLASALYLTYVSLLS